RALLTNHLPELPHDCLTHKRLTTLATDFTGPLAATTVEPLPPATKPASILSEPPEPDTQPDAEPAPTPVPYIWRQRRLVSMADTLDKAPDNLRPRRGDQWTDANQNPFTTWCIEELLGTILEQRLHCIAATVQPADQPRHWLLQPTFDTPDFLCFGTMQSWTLSFPPLLIDDDTLALWKTYHRGIVMKVKGRIQSVHISRHGDSPTGLPQFQFEITLARPEITPPPYPPKPRHSTHQRQ
ncbi:MAG: hypothetical protein ACTHN5_03945, partial [Phycisphaerae bacterium]